MALSLIFLVFALACYTQVLSSPDYANGDDEPPGSNIYVKKTPGQLSISEYESILAKPTGYSRHYDNDVLIRDSDIVLTPAQYRDLYKERRNNVGYKAEIREDRRWTNNVIPYTIDAKHFSESQTLELHRAMETFMNVTCLVFRPKKDTDKNWIKLTDNNSGCNSMLGMMGWGEQSVNLGSGCKWRGLYLHEIGHALGLIHEHQRPDRDLHSNIIWRRVKSDYLSAFTLYKNKDVNDYGIPYDYSSIMHYEPEAFNDDQEITTQPRIKWKIELMYRVFYKTLSFTDSKVLNLMYKCGKQCRNKCRGNAYLDKNCKCVTPEDIYDELCVNEKPDEECYSRVKMGHCGSQWDSAEMNIYCRKACGSCPTYGRDAELEPRLSKPLDACVDRYHDSARCEQWTAEGACDQYPSWMKRYCRKSCNQCDKKKNNCRNYYKGAPDDVQCDAIAAEGGCDDPLKRAGCQDSCNACGYQIPGDCEDDYDGCVGPAVRGECDDNDPALAAHVQSLCRKSCNTCDLNQGKCSKEELLVDQLPAYECLLAASQGKCRIEPEKYKKHCKQACNSCNFGVVDKSCNDVDPEPYCAGYLRRGDCAEKKGYAYRFCASSCNTCDFARNPPCEDLEDMCADWAKRGECTANFQYMSTHCSKSCETCHRLKLGTCHNLEHDAFCEEEKINGDCEKFGETTMKKKCRRSCGFCQAPKIERFWECKDLLPDRCGPWVERGECEANPIYMKAFCSLSCGHCPKK